MASDPARRCGLLGPLLREVGLEREAAFCDLIRASGNYSRGVDVDGNPVTPEANLAAIKKFNACLAAMRDACLKLEQTSRGAVRLRGFISEELFKLYKMSENALEGIIGLAKTNGLVHGLRATLPYSAVNETEHALMRRASPNVLIAAVARAAGQLLELTLLLTDLARSWIWPVGCGVEATYQSTVEQDADDREEALRAWHRDGTRLHDLKRHQGRKKPKGDGTMTGGAALAEGAVEEDRPTTSESPPLKMVAFAAATNARLHKVKLGFRAAVAHKDGDSHKYGRPMSVRRSLLARAMEAPHLLKNAKAKGRASTFPVAAVTLIDGGKAWRLACSITTSTVVVRPKPKQGVLLIDVISANEVYTAPMPAIYGFVWDLAPGALPTDGDGVVEITMAIVSGGRIQVLSLRLLKKDVNTCRMLANFAPLQTVVFGSALVEGGEPTDRAQLLRALTQGLASEAADPPVMNVGTLKAPWEEVDVSAALASMTGLTRLAAVPATPPPALGDAVRAVGGGNVDGDGGDGMLQLKPPTARAKGKRAKDTAEPPTKKQATGPRRVRAEIEDSDEKAIYAKKASNRDALLDKWEGLRVHDPANEDATELRGEIVDFKYVAGSTKLRGQYVAVIQIDGDEQGDGEPVAMMDLPKMVQAAEDEQPDAVLLDYDRDDDNEFGETSDAEVVELEKFDALRSPDDDLGDADDALEDALGDDDDDDAPDLDAEPEPAEPNQTMPQPPRRSTRKAQTPTGS